MMQHDNEPLEGGFNTNIFQLNEADKLVLERIPRSNHDLLENIAYEFQAIGFTTDGGRVERRTLEEQVYFANTAAANGLKALPFIRSRDKWVMPYLENMTPINEYLQSDEITDQEKNMTVFDLLTDLNRAHQQGVVYGDRWAGNMIVEKNKIMHIDFDLELSGTYAREADLAQMLYHLILADHSQTTLLLTAEIISNEFQHHDIAKTLKYIKGFAKFFAGTPVGGIDDAVEKAVDMITMRKRSHQYGGIIIGNGSYF